MKKMVLVILLSTGLSVAPTQQGHAVVWVVVKAVLVKIIRAMDLAIQRLQNKTIWLQEAQKQLENTMSKLQLDKISDWVERQRVLYTDYYQELRDVKSIIAYYQRIRSITEKQLQLMDTYKKAWARFRDDRHFSVQELIYMESVYSGMIGQSLQNIDQVMLVIRTAATQMTDAKRLELINTAADRIDKNYADLLAFNLQNQLLSLQRSRDQNDIDLTRKLFGL